MKLRPEKRKLIRIGNSLGVTIPSEMLYKLDENKDYVVVFKYKKNSSNPEIWEIYLEVKKK